jgi:DNA-binding CsgD family transcriptional regulator
VQLLDRTDELTALDGALREALAGSGAMVLVEGPPGIGKTELVAAATAHARRLGMTVLSACGAELERSFPYAVVRQLFEPAVTQADRLTRQSLLSGAAVHAARVVDPCAEPDRTPVEPSAVLHGLYWLVANLAADRPVVLAVDDLHWCDPTSMSWLAYLARRIEGLPVALVMAARPAEPGADDALLEQLRATGGLQRLVPAPLRLAAVDRLARTALGAQVEPAFTEACHAATRGNPFYVSEVLRALRMDGVAGIAANVDAIDRLTPRAVVDATLARLGRLPIEVRSVAEAVALLEPNAELRWIVELTGRDDDAVAGAADVLLRLGVLRSVTPCQFEHPILRSAVEYQIAPARRGRLHLRAAGALAAGGVPVDAVAAHLMLTPPSGEPWVVSTLAEAAGYASAGGAHRGAVVYLRRALVERPPARERRELLLQLGKAERQTRMPEATGHLREALALAEDADQTAAAALALGHAYFAAGAIDEAYEMVRDAVRLTDQRESQAALELQAFLLSIAGPAGTMAETAGRAAKIEAHTSHTSRGAASVHASLALRDLVAGRPYERIRDRAERALADRTSSSGPMSPALGRAAPGMALLWVDELGRATELFTDAIKDASAMGRIPAFENYCALRGYAARRSGNLADAEADIEPILAAAGQDETHRVATLLALITKVLLLIDRGRPGAAEALALSAPVPAAFARLPIVALLRHAQALAELAQHKPSEAATTLTRVGEVCEATGIRSPAVIPWRSALALALAGTDRHPDGIELARTELRLAEQCGVQRARGVALRTLGVLEGGQAGLRRLEAAVRAFERSPARLEVGWASYELGAALRRRARRRDARPPLNRALDAALACGAELLAERAGEELKALGGRPRSSMRTGAESLTPSERRVCRLASEGMKNREIAQTLFVSLRTVETHLGNSYRKLDITTRAELSRTLAATPR